MVSYTALVMRVCHFSEIWPRGRLRAGRGQRPNTLKFSLQRSPPQRSCVFNKPFQITILVVYISHKYKRVLRIIFGITTYYSRLIFRLLPIVSLVYSGVSHITVGETITNWCSELKPVWFYRDFKQILRTNVPNWEILRKIYFGNYRPEIFCRRKKI